MGKAWREISVFLLATTNKLMSTGYSPKSSSFLTSANNNTINTVFVKTLRICYDEEIYLSLYQHQNRIKNKTVYNNIMQEYTYIDNKQAYEHHNPPITFSVQ